MRRWLQLFFRLLAASAFAYVPEPNLLFPKNPARRGLASVTAATNAITCGYDPNGNCITLTNRNGKKWQFIPISENRNQ